MSFKAYSVRDLTDLARISHYQMVTQKWKNSRPSRAVKKDACS
jgi:hypothetical protein